ncbi:MAG: hypothetical protein WC617_12635 [Rhodanobacter sp.]|jgi:hypothetical protein
MTTVSALRPTTPTTVAPFSEGQWAAENQDFEHPEIAHIKTVYWDDIAHEWVMDLVLYSPDGDRIGRKSPRMGGPSGFEPCVPCQSWSLIRKPEFPLGRDRTGFRDWKSSLEYIERHVSADSE